MIIDSHWFKPKSIVTEDEDFFEALNVDRETYEPLKQFGQFSAESLDVILAGFERLHIYDPELHCLRPRHIVQNWLPPFREYCFLNAKITPQDIRFRQEAVKELLEKPELRRQLGEIFISLPIRHGGMYDDGGLHKDYLRCQVTVGRAVELLERIKELRADSRALRRCVQWVEELEKDSVWQEQVRDRRKVTDRRVAAFFSERYGGIVYAIAKPGTTLEDHFDILSNQVHPLTFRSPTKKDPNRYEKRKVVKYRSELDRTLVERAVGEARQRMDQLNQISSWMLAEPLTMMITQLRHYYHGSTECRNYTTFPTICDDMRINIEGMLPIRLLHSSRPYEHKPVPNRFNIGDKDRLILIRGANNRGKSEAARSFHMLNHLVNAGFPIPADTCEYGICTASHFIQCKGDMRHGGSEFWYSCGMIMGRLHAIHPGQQVILDELGDLTNGPTAIEQARRLLPILLERECRVIVTTHNGELGQYLQEQGAKCYAPAKNTPFKLVLKRGKLDYNPEGTLDEMGFTETAIREGMSAEKLPMTDRRGIPPKRSSFDYDDPYEDTDPDLIF
ncbi:hypothetical protein KY329_00670 [Candidatus Woesearchaeota archaeon]|nr:hypothetical protein [Candidatus Woesearchaeota archaeon]